MGKNKKEIYDIIKKAPKKNNNNKKYTQQRTKLITWNTFKSLFVRNCVKPEVFGYYLSKLDISWDSIIAYFRNSHKNDHLYPQNQKKRKGYN